MAERAASGPMISPVQQMMASGTGAILTSLFGEILETKTRKSNSCLMHAHFGFIVTNVFKVQLNDRRI